MSYLLTVNAMAQRSEIVIGYPHHPSASRTQTSLPMEEAVIIKYKPSTA
jgi:hypothetical protein